MQYRQDRRKRMMKRIVLTKLSSEDAQILITKDANAFTLKTLLKNQYLSETDYSEIEDLLKELYIQKNKIYEEYVEKYRLPHIANNNYRVSPHSNELYIEVYE